MQEDVAFGFRQLVDVATKALSPGVNDPTTAVHAFAHLTSLLTTLSSGHLLPRLRSDAAGHVRVVGSGARPTRVPRPGVRPDPPYGAAEPAVTSELLRLLRDVARCDLDAAGAAAVRKQADMVLAAAERSTPEPRDLEPLRGIHQRVHEMLAG